MQKTDEQLTFKFGDRDVTPREMKSLLFDKNPETRVAALKAVHAGCYHEIQEEKDANKRAQLIAGTNSFINSVHSHIFTTEYTDKIGDLAMTNKCICTNYFDVSLHPDEVQQQIEEAEFADHTSKLASINLQENLHDYLS